MNRWWQDAIFYHIYPLGFCGVKERAPDPFHPMHTLHKIEEWIDHLVDLGITAIYFGPVFSSSKHGYDTADYYHIDSRLGTNQEFRELCKKIKSRGIRIILDGVFHHTGREFWAFRDLLEKREGSHYSDWFSSVRFHQSSPYGDPFSYDGWEGHYSLVKLNLKNSGVKHHLFDAVDSWIRDYDIDGLRLDVAYALDMEFISQLASFCRGRKSDFFLLGEVIHGDYNRFLSSHMLDSVTNYECYKGIFSSHNDRNLFEIAASLDRQYGAYGLYTSTPLYNFLDNHDVNRIASMLNHPAWVHTAYLLLFTMPGIPSIYYGSEWGMKGKRENHSDHQLRPSSETVVSRKSDPAVEETIKKLIQIRQGNHALKHGSYQRIHTEQEVFAFLRYAGEEKVIVIVNSADSPKTISLRLHENRGYVDVLNNGEQINPGNGMTDLIVYPCWGRILV